MNAFSNSATGGNIGLRQRLLWSRRRLANAGQQRQRKRQTKTYNEKTGIYEFPRNEESVLDEIRWRLQSAGARVFRVRERIPEIKCPECKAKIFVGQSSEPGHPDLHGYFPSRVWNRLRIPEPLPEVQCHLALRPVTRPVHFFIEVKRPKGGVVSYHQEAFVRQCNDDREICFVANDWEVVRNNFYEQGIKLRAADEYVKLAA